MYPFSVCIKMLSGQGSDLWSLASVALLVTGCSRQVASASGHTDGFGSHRREKFLGAFAVDSTSYSNGHGVAGISNSRDFTVTGCAEEIKSTKPGLFVVS